MKFTILFIILTFALTQNCVGIIYKPLIKENNVATQEIIFINICDKNITFVVDCYGKYQLADFIFYVYQRYTSDKYYHRLNVNENVSIMSTLRNERGYNINYPINICKINALTIV